MKALFFLVCFALSLHAATLGETLFHGNCVTCHDVSKANSAPAIQDVQTRYKQRFDTEKKFTAFMVAWLQKPDAKSAIMQEAVNKFGLMPTLGYDEETLYEIAQFLYTTSFKD